MENKNEFFEEVLTSATFVHRSKSLPLVVEYSDQDLKVIRIANIKTIEIERDFVKEWTENHFCSCMCCDHCGTFLVYCGEKGKFGRK